MAVYVFLILPTDFCIQLVVNFLCPLSRVAIINEILRSPILLNHDRFPPVNYQIFGSQ
jgi:hypothetical protein